MLVATPRIAHSLYHCIYGCAYAYTSVTCLIKYYPGIYLQLQPQGQQAQRQPQRKVWIARKHSNVVIFSRKRYDFSPNRVTSI